MPLYLIREHTVPGPMTVVAASSISEFEVEAATARQAARAVMYRAPRDPALKVRVDCCPYTRAYVEPEAGRYAQVVDIERGKPASLPKYPPLPGVLEAALTVFQQNAKLAGIDDEGDPSVALYHTLHAVIAYAAAREVDLKKVVTDILDDYEAMTANKAPRIEVPEFPPQASESEVAIGEELVRTNAAALRLPLPDDREFGLFYLVTSLIQYADHHRIDFGDTLREVVLDRQQSLSPRM